MGRLLSFDSGQAPSGSRWFRGFTARRIGIVLTLCVLYTLHSVGESFVVGFRAGVWGLAIKLTMICVAAMPFAALVTIADNLTSGPQTRRRVLALALAVTFGALLAGAIEASLYRVAFDWLPFGHKALEDVYADYLEPIRDLRWADFLFAPLGTFWGVPLNVWTGFSTHWLMYGAFLTAVYFFVTRERVTAAALHESQLRRQSLERQMTEARLQVLQAQIEPHFLFNTLATIQRLYVVDRAQGKAMLRNLGDYLRAALPRMRESGSTLGRELELIDAYLNVQQVRMGERLKVEKFIVEELLGASLPPMILLTLVENAIKHGLGPLPNGGTLRIRAEGNGVRLRLVVEDNGAGFHEPAGSGVGLANTRERLATLYGDESRLLFEGNADGGITVTIELPYRLPQREAVPS